MADRNVTTKISIRHLGKAICVFDAMVQLQIQGANTKEKNRHIVVSY